LGLIFHEVTHINGYGEPVAQAMQASFEHVFHISLGTVKEYDVSQNNEATIAKILDVLARFKDEKQVRSLSLLEIGAGLEQVHDDLLSISYWNNPWALKIAYPLKDISAGYAFSYSVWNALQTFQECQNTLCTDSFLRPKSGFKILSRQEILLRLKQLVRRFDIVQYNWHNLHGDGEFAGGRSILDIKSICIQPRVEKMNPNQKSEFLNYFPVAPSSSFVEPEIRSIPSCESDFTTTDVRTIDWIFKN